MKTPALLFLAAVALLGCKRTQVDALVVFRDASYPGSEMFVVNSLPALICDAFSMERAPLSGLVQTSEEWILRGKEGSTIHDVQVVALGHEGRLSVFIDSPTLSSDAAEIVAIKKFIVDRAGDLVVLDRP